MLALVSMDRVMYHSPPFLYIVFKAYSMKTIMATNENVSPKWYVVDAKGKTLGRLASRLAFRLRGKHKPTFTPHIDTGDFIVVINADQLVVTGQKADKKRYHRHTGYPGGIRDESFATLHARLPGRVLEMAVRGMLPKGPLGRKMFKKMKVYAGAEHPHASQQPETLEGL